MKVVCGLRTASRSGKRVVNRSRHHEVEWLDTTQVRLLDAAWAKRAISTATSCVETGLGPPHPIAGSARKQRSIHHREMWLDEMEHFGWFVSARCKSLYSELRWRSFGSLA